MPKEYDPILCMMVEKPEVKKANDAKYEVQYVPKTSTNGSRMTKVVEAMNAKAAEEKFFKQYPGLAGAKIFNTTKVSDAEVESPRSNKKYKIYGDVVTLKSITSATVTYETSNGYTQKIGRRKWNELAVKVTDAAATVDKAIKVMDADQTFYVEIKSTMKGVEGRTIMVKASNKADAKRKAESEAGQYGRVGKVISREESRAQAGNHGVISNNWKR